MGGVVTSIISGSYGPLLITGSGGPPCNKSVFFKLWTTFTCPSTVHGWHRSLHGWEILFCTKNAMFHDPIISQKRNETYQQKKPPNKSCLFDPNPQPQPPPNKQTAKSENLAFFLDFLFGHRKSPWLSEVWCRWRWGEVMQVDKLHKLTSFWEVGRLKIPLRGPRGGLAPIPNKCFLAFLDFWLPSTSSTSIFIGLEFFFDMRGPWIVGWCVSSLFVLRTIQGGPHHHKLLIVWLLVCCLLLAGLVRQP